MGDFSNFLHCHISMKQENQKFSLTKNIIFCPKMLHITKTLIYFLYPIDSCNYLKQTFLSLFLSFSKTPQTLFIFYKLSNISLPSSTFISNIFLFFQAPTFLYTLQWLTRVTTTFLSCSMTPTCKKILKISLQEFL